MVETVNGFQIHVDGIVQGVGFRPFVYNLAKSLDLHGWVRNTSNGVDITIAGLPENLGAFLNELRNRPPRVSANRQYLGFTLH